MGAVGAFVGPVLFLFVLLGSFLVSGLMAMVEMMRTRRVKETFHNLFVLVQGVLFLRIACHTPKYLWTILRCSSCPSGWPLRFPH